MLAVLSLVAMMALAPGVMAGGTVVVTALPGGGWIRSLDNTAGGTVQLVPGPGPGTLGIGSVQLTTAATADFAGVAHPFLAVGIPYAELTAASWRTFVTSATGNRCTCRCVLSGYQDGIIPLGEFTTLIVERVYQPGLAHAECLAGQCAHRYDDGLADHRQRGWVLPQRRLQPRVHIR